MLIKPITYNTYDGQKLTEDFYFNMTEAELMEMHLSTTGGMEQTVRRIIASHDQPTLFKLFKDLILKAYGVKSLDGKRFEKSEKLRTEFEQCPAYSVLFMELVGNADKAAEFIMDIMPAELRDKAKEETEKFKSTLNLPEGE